MTAVTIGATGAQSEFEQKLMDRIRASVGELMTDADLKRIMEAGVQKCLFEPQRVPSRERYGADEIRASFVERMTQELLAKEMEKAVQAWLVANSDKLEAAVQDAIKQGAGLLMVEAIGKLLQPALFRLGEDVRREFSQRCGS